jgi:hypothetical protein
MLGSSGLTKRRLHFCKLKNNSRRSPCLPTLTQLSLALWKQTPWTLLWQWSSSRLKTKEPCTLLPSCLRKIPQLSALAKFTTRSCWQLLEPLESGSQSFLVQKSLSRCNQTINTSNISCQLSVLVATTPARANFFCVSTFRLSTVQEHKGLSLTP